jgi:hypothetical protein
MRVDWLFEPAGDHVAVRRILLSGMGGVYQIAILSLGAQIHALVGSGGILPNTLLFDAMRESERVGFVHAPSACWWLGCSDPALSALCVLGAVGALLLCAGSVPALAAGLCWFAYLSLFYAGQIFLGFQWDILLLEAGFLALWLAPPRAWSSQSPHWQRPPSRLVLLLFRWLLFRLMFMSGVVKLSSGDLAWRGLTAMAFHYETQPLPTWTSWYAHQLPLELQQLSTLGTFAVELGVPFLFFAPRRARLAAALASAGLMFGVALTGNYGFFNLLAIVLCVSLLDDRVLPARLRRLLRREPAADAPAPRGAAWPRWLVAPIAAYVLVSSVVPLASSFRQPWPWLETLAPVYGLQQGFRLTNRYGLFAVMTTKRPEIVVEGSRDGASWEPYEFRWKPGDPGRRPRFVQPHMPRLDWQMWFAALRGEPSPWLLSFCRRLLEGSPQVLELLASNPFPQERPLYLRATLYDYRFTNREQRRDSGAWWQRVALGPMILPMRLAPRR